eukprot:TRINITY_DN12243_c3_g1_i2.p1 TRINITY_DN12243_c3_g1~~TRINITY_DN12243_c3_g1_i2.p1  ORF type:complete len:691 (+),score=157.02 TRINITY_DN12243_c3_g1_i2:1492-3564(+)
MKLCVALLGLIAFSKALSPVLYIDGINGNDSNPGTQSQPFKTPRRAQQEIRSAAGAFPEGGITVIVHDGHYDLSAGPLALNASDSGTPERSVVWRAADNAKPVFASGKVLQNTVLDVVKREDGTAMVKIDLKAQGIIDYGRIVCNTGLGQCPTAHIADAKNGRMELFVNGASRVLARYPNVDLNSTYWQWDQIKTVNSSLVSFTYSDERMSRWANETDDLWLWGYWKFDWADSIVKVDGIDAANMQFFVNKTTPPTYSFMPKARFFGFNLLSELDQVDEYYIDRRQGLLYYIAQSMDAATSDELVVSQSYSSLTMSGVTNVRFDGIGFGYARGNGVTIEGSTNVTIANADIRNVGGNGVSISSCKNVTLTDSAVTNIGCRGVSVNCGSKTTLEPGNCKLSNTQVSHVARFTRTYNPALGFGGAGNVYTNNTLFNSPHAGILGGGNNNLFEYNHIHDMCYEVDDSGAFYTGRQWTQRGNVVRYNRFESIRTRVPIYLGSPAVQGLYLDDQMSGYEIYNNSFKDCQNGILLGGGRSNHIKYNTFEHCDLAIHVDDRGTSWQTSYCQPGGTFQQELEALNYMEPPYITAYPELENIMLQRPCYPTLNHVMHNYACDCINLFNFNITLLNEWDNVFTNNNNVSTPGCVPDGRPQPPTQPLTRQLDFVPDNQPWFHRSEEEIEMKLMWQQSRADL